MNPNKQKIRRITADEDYKMIGVLSKPHIKVFDTTFDQINWDCVNLMMKFLDSRENFPILRGVSK